MQKRILVSVDAYETQVAIFEDAALAEYFFERSDTRRMAGNLYKGKVASIIPGIDAAFVDIGLPRNAFLYVSDALAMLENYDDMLEEAAATDGEGDADQEGENGDLPHSQHPLPDMTISDLLNEGQDVLVQMLKEPIGAKGSRVTTNLTLPGRYLVLLPCTRHIGISRKIEDEDERERLRQVAESMIDGGMGVIIRTAAEGVREEQLTADYQFLVRQFNAIQKKYDSAKAPALLHHDLTIAQRVVRDVFTDEVREFIVDELSTFKEVVDLAQLIVPDLTDRITLYQKSLPLFEAAGVDNELRHLTRKRLWLACGGYLVFDESEALTAIDVNTGRYLGKNSLEETVFHTNIEAAVEIGRQIRLRDIGGIIVIDFIDMRDETHRSEVLAALEQALKRDRSRTQITEITSLGLVQMTRKRVRQSLSRTLRQPCPYCNGEGVILSLDTMVIRALRRVEERCRIQSPRNIEIHVNPRVARRLGEAFRDHLEALSREHGVKITVRGNPQLHLEDIDEGSGTGDSRDPLTLPLVETGEQD